MKKLIEIVARSGMDFVPLLIFEEEVVFRAKQSIDEIAKLFKGKILKLEGEICLFIPKDVPPQALKIIQENEKFKKWWEMATLQKFGEEEGKIFIIREV